MSRDSVISVRLAQQLDRVVKVQMLGLAHLQSNNHPPHRPPTIASALKRDDIAQFVEYYRALHPRRPKEESILAAAEYAGVNRAYAYRAWASVSAERRQALKASAAAFAEALPALKRIARLK